MAPMPGCGVGAEGSRCPSAGGPAELTRWPASSEPGEEDAVTADGAPRPWGASAACLRQQWSFGSLMGEVLTGSCTGPMAPTRPWERCPGGVPGLQKHSQRWGYSIFWKSRNRVFLPK